jgi:hypothetical protein
MVSSWTCSKISDESAVLLLAKFCCKRQHKFSSELIRYYSPKKSATISSLFICQGNTLQFSVRSQSASGKTEQRDYIFTRLLRAPGSTGTLLGDPTSTRTKGDIIGKPLANQPENSCKFPVVPCILVNKRLDPWYRGHRGKVKI